MRRCCLIVAWIGVLSVVSAADADINGYELLSDWSLLPQARVGVQSHLASSYDRDGGNLDWNQYESPIGHLNDDSTDDDIVTTVTTLSGPGVITRFWMPHATSNAGAGGVFPVKIRVDGVLAIDTNTDALLGGAYDAADTNLFKGPLVSSLIGGQVSYEPIVFQDSLVIETKNYAGTSHPWAQRRHYYQWSYMKLPAGSNVTSYTGTLTPRQTIDRSDAVSMMENVGANPAGASATSSTVNTSSQLIPAGQSLDLGSISGSGRIRAINLKLPEAATDGQMDGLRLRVRYDGLSRAAVDVPVSQFFGAGHGRAPYQSMPLGASDTNELYSYWPMPYRREVSVELYNESGGAISIDSAAVEYDPGEVPDDAYYLHAVYREDNTIALAGQPYGYHQMLSVSGQGHYVGNLLNLSRDGTSRSILEGDDLILVDGGDVGGGHTLYGTGLEDAYNGGYYYNHVLDQSDDGDIPNPTSGTQPFHGLLAMEDADSNASRVRTDQYRWLIADAVPFSDGIEVLQERYGSAEANYNSVAFYYLLPRSGDANDDLRVDLEDFVILRSTYGQSGVGLAADFDEDGDVDLDDYEIFVASFGMAGSPEAPILPEGLSVPEPTSVMLLILGVSTLVRRGRRY